MTLPSASAGAPSLDNEGKSVFARAGLNSAIGLPGTGSGCASLATDFAIPRSRLAGVGESDSTPNSASGSSAGSLDGNGLAMTPVTPTVVQEALPGAQRLKTCPD